MLTDANPCFRWPSVKWLTREPRTTYCVPMTKLRRRNAPQRCKMAPQNSNRHVPEDGRLQLYAVGEDGVPAFTRQRPRQCGQPATNAATNLVSSLSPPHEFGQTVDGLSAATAAASPTMQL